MSLLTTDGLPCRDVEGTRRSPVDLVAPSIEPFTSHLEPWSGCANGVVVPSGSFRRGYGERGHWHWCPFAVVADERPYDVDEASGQGDQRVHS